MGDAEGMAGEETLGRVRASSVLEPQQGGWGVCSGRTRRGAGMAVGVPTDEILRGPGGHGEDFGLYTEYLGSHLMFLSRRVT